MRSLDQYWDTIDANPMRTPRQKAKLRDRVEAIQQGYFENIARTQGTRGRDFDFYKRYPASVYQKGQAGREYTAAFLGTTVDKLYGKAQKDTAAQRASRGRTAG